MNSTNVEHFVKDLESRFLKQHLILDLDYGTVFVMAGEKKRREYAYKYIFRQSQQSHEISAMICVSMVFRDRNRPYLLFLI